MRDKYGAKIARVVTFKTGDRNVVIFTLGIYAENYNLRIQASQPYWLILLETPTTSWSWRI
ncbi:MAG: hypothetical protein QW700_07835 [Desulfurococcaceae archaeon]